MYYQYEVYYPLIENLQMKVMGQLTFIALPDHMLVSKMY